MLEWVIARSGSAKPELTASALLKEFGSLSAVLGADNGRLAHAAIGDSEAANAIATFRTVMRYALRENVAARPVLGNWAALLDHLRSEIAFSPIERFHVLHLDIRNGLIIDDVASIGTIDTAPVYVRELIRRALDVGAASLVLAHNHPSGDPTPSHQDVALTRSLINAARVFDITIHDHLIITAHGYTSMRAEGLIQ